MIMKTILLGAAAAVLALAAPAAAADMQPRTYTKAPAYTPPQVIYNWPGFSIGAGLEYMFAPNWSAKAEYQYYNFGSTTITSGPADVVGVRGREDEHTVKVGVNYRFGWGGPSASRY